jgi:hypothetical protein
VFRSSSGSTILETLLSRPAAPRLSYTKRTYEWLGRVGALTVQESEYWLGRMRYFLPGIRPSIQRT